MTHKTVVIKWTERDTQSPLVYFRAECYGCNWHSRLFLSKGIATVSKNLHQRQDELSGKTLSIGAEASQETTKESAHGKSD